MVKESKKLGKGSKKMAKGSKKRWRKVNRMLKGSKKILKGKWHLRAIVTSVAQTTAQLFFSFRLFTTINTVDGNKLCLIRRINNQFFK